MSSDTLLLFKILSLVWSVEFEHGVGNSLMLGHILVLFILVLERKVKRYSLENSLKEILFLTVF